MVTVSSRVVYTIFMILLTVSVEFWILAHYTNVQPLYHISARQVLFVASQELLIVQHHLVMCRVP